MATRGRTDRQVLSERAPWKPAPYTDLEHAAVKALTLGNATPAQQKAFITWLVNNCCRTYDLSYRPGGPEGQRDTDFAEGRRSVGLQVVHLANTPITTTRREGQ